MDKNNKRCYTFPVKAEEKQKEKLIIQIIMHQDKIDTLFEGWKKKDENIDMNKTLENKIDNIMDEKFFLFDKKKIDFNKYDNESEKYKGKDSNFNFCVFSKMELLLL